MMDAEKNICASRVICEGCKKVTCWLNRLFNIYKPIGAAPQGHFFVGGGGGVWAKKVVMLRRLWISEKKEILRKPTVL